MLKISSKRFALRFPLRDSFSTNTTSFLNSFNHAKFESPLWKCRHARMNKSFLELFVKLMIAVLLLTDLWRYFANAYNCYLSNISLSRYICLTESYSISESVPLDSCHPELLELYSRSYFSCGITSGFISSSISTSNTWTPFSPKCTLTISSSSYTSTISSSSTCFT